MAVANVVTLHRPRPTARAEQASSSHPALRGCPSAEPPTHPVVGSNIAPDGQPVTAVRVTDSSSLPGPSPAQPASHQVNDGATIQFAAGNKTVNVGGFEVEPAVAETLRRVAPGGLADSPQPTSEQPSAPQSEQPNAQPEVDPLDVIRTLWALRSSRRPGRQGLVISPRWSRPRCRRSEQNAVRNRTVRGGSRYRPDLATGRFGIVVAELTKQAQKLAAENNIDFAEFNRWAAAHYRDTAAQAILKHLQTSSTRGLGNPYAAIRAARRWAMILPATKSARRAEVCQRAREDSSL